MLRGVDTRNAIGDDTRMRRLSSLLLLLLATFALTVIATPTLQAQAESEQTETAEEAEDQDAEAGDETADDDEVAEPDRRRPRLGDDVRLFFEDGTTLEGRYIGADGRTVTLEISNVEVRIERLRIERVLVLEPPAERFEKLRALIDETDFDRRAGLAEWASGQGMHDIALKELDSILREEPLHGPSLKLRPIVAKLDEMSRREKSNRKPRQLQPDAPRRPGIDEFPLLSEDEINLMKVFEVELRNNPRLIIDRETVDELLARYADHPLIPTSREGRRAFHRKAPAEILDIMFQVRARDLYRDVIVVDQPKKMTFFRDKIHAGWLVNSCATTRCHGSTEGGKLQLTNRRPTSEESVYTNFLILDRFVTSDNRRLLNYDDPELSPLLHYALPRDDALTPHPRVRGWTPVFRNRDARKFRQSVEWIEMLYQPRPDYPIEYTPPTGSGDPEDEEPPVER